MYYAMLAVGVLSFVFLLLSVVAPAIQARISAFGTQVAVAAFTDTPTNTLTATATYTPTATLTFTPSSTWTPWPSWTPSLTPNHTATLQIAFAVQTARAFDATATAMWWTDTPIPTHPPTATPFPTATSIPVAVADAGNSPAAREPAATTTPGGSLVSSFLLFIAGIAGAGGVLLTVYQALKQVRIPALPKLTVKPWRPYTGTRWVEPVEHSALVEAGLTPHLAAALIQAWGEPVEVTGHTTHAHIAALWEAVLTTLAGRGMLRKDAQPQTRRVIAAPDRVIYVLDMAQLGGVPLEKWTAEGFIEQLRATAGGCRVVVTTEGGLAIQVARQPAPVPQAEDPAPEQPQPAPLPTLAPLGLTTRPRPAYSLGVGVSREGPIWAPLESLGHIMVSGSTGSGKSYFLRSLAYQFITLPRSQKVSLYLADRAGNVFTPLDAYQVPQLAAPAAKTPEAVVGMLNAAIAEMQRRERLFDAEIDHFPDKLAEYNAIEGVKPLPRLVVIVDEVTVLVAETGGERGEVHQALLALAAQGRKYGVTLIVAGQDFKASTFNTALTHQLATRIAFKAGSAHESRVVLGEEGAERLRGAGHGLLRHGGRLVEFQGFFVDKNDLIARCKAIGTEPAPGPALSDWEVKLVEYALEHLDGVLARAALVEANLGSGYQIRKQIEVWREAGLVVSERRMVGAAARDVLVVTPRLAALVRSWSPDAPDVA